MPRHATNARIDELAAEVAALQQTVALLVAERPPAPAPDSDATRFISVTEAARLAGVSTQSIRNWIDRYSIGRFINPAYLVDRRLLREHLIRHRGKLPLALSRG